MDDPRRTELVIIAICCPSAACRSTDVACRGAGTPGDTLARWYCRNCGKIWKDVHPSELRTRRLAVIDG